MQAEPVRSASEPSILIISPRNSNPRLKKESRNLQIPQSENQNLSITRENETKRKCHHQPQAAAAATTT